MNWETYTSKAVQEIPASGIRKFWVKTLAIPDVLSLCIGEPDYAPPKKVLDECIASINRQETHYTENLGLPALRQAIASMYKRKYNVEYALDEIMLTIGASEAIDLAVRVFLNPGDEVLIPDPSYVAYPAEVILCGATPVMVPTYGKDGFKLRPEELEKKITPKTKMLIMGFPSNPTGAIMDADELAAIAKIAIKHDLIVVSDEIYSELTYGSGHVSMASLPNMKERTLVLNGFSKAYAMTGLRIGYLCGPAEVVALATKIHQYSIVAPATPIQKAAIVAINECEDSIKEMRDEYEARRNIIVNGFREMGLEIATPNGAFYAFPDISSTGLSDEEFAERLLAEEKVAVVPGSAFGACGKNHVRCSYASSREDIQEAIVRIGHFVKKYQK